MDIPTLKQLIQVCMGHGNARAYKALFLCDFFRVFHLSNLPSHTVHGFDPLKQFGGGGGVCVIFGKKKVTLFLKWSKALQDRDQVRTGVLPKLKNPLICPFRAHRIDR